MSPSLDLVALSLLPLTRWRRVAIELRQGSTPAAILERQCEEGAALPGRARVWADATRLRARAAVACEVGGSRLSAVAWTDARYPGWLQEIPDPPPVLWVDGDADVLTHPAVAVVGSRAGTPYALRVAERLSADLAAQGLTVVSGLARGVDAAAHQGALAVHGRTVAVVGCGADVVYPAEHQALAAAICGRGAVVSEFPPGTVPRPEFFPRRNRVISGLSRAVVVVEAGERSGSLITARCALEQGRDVLAVPGNVLSGRNRGGHALLRDGARLVETASDVLEELGLGRTASGGDQTRLAPGDPVLDALVPGEAAELAEIAAISGLPAASLLPRLLELELEGAVRREPGGRFVRFDRTC